VLLRLVVIPRDIVFCKSPILAETRASIIDFEGSRFGPAGSGDSRQTSWEHGLAANLGQEPLAVAPAAVQA
jgi:hypothetical protein